MPPTTRHRARSSVDHIFDLVGDLDEDQLSNLLHELNSSSETNVQVSQGVEYFEEQRRARAAQKALRPTPSFINAPHEPVDWPKQKPRPVSGSYWRQNMRVSSTPYGAVARNHTEPISPPLTASPPLSPPLSPPKHNNNNNNNKSPRRSVTAPVQSGDKSPRVQIKSIPLERSTSPPRQRGVVDDDRDETEQPFASFSFDGPGAAPATPRRQSREAEDDSQSLSPDQSPRQRQQQRQQQLGFGGIDVLPRPRTATGDAATTVGAFKPRAFRRISRPTFLSPANIPAPDALAQRLSQFLFEDPSPPFPPMAAPTAAPVSSRRQGQQEEPSMEDLLKEPAAPPSLSLFGRVEKEVPSVGIFEVLSDG